MANVNANIRIDIATAGAVSRLRQLQSQINAFNNSVARGNAAAAASQAALAGSMASMLGSTGRFATSIRDVETATRQLGTAFDRGTLSARQYFRYAGSQVPGLTKAFKGLAAEQAAMHRLAEARVKRLNTQYVSLGRTIQGTEKVLAARPLALPKGMATDIAMAQQRQQLFNRALQLGSTGLVNWGKNTQWAGRQLMVGFTVPLTIAAGAAAKFYMELDKASMQFRRVYGDMNTSTAETERNLKAMMDLGKEYTKYGIAVKDVVDVSARAAATGAQNEDLMAATEQTLRLATLGQMEYQRALDATISLQTAFAISSEDLGNKIDFLNAVENQTVLTMEDMALAVPRVAPVIKGLGGDVEDLAVFMTALREGGVSAEQGANALKSGLASLINPTTQAKEMLKGLGINIEAIVQANKGDLMGTVKAFGEALNGLQEFERQQALEQVFGKYQYARLGALFKNIANDASQSARAMDLAGASAEELRAISEKELGTISETVTSQFLGAIERLKLAIAPIGEMFLKAVTPVVNAVSAIANAFANLPDPVKNAIGLIVVAIGAIAPVFLMGLGLVGNAIGNIIKIMLVMRNGIKGVVAALTGQAASHKYLTEAELESAAAMTSLSGKTTALTSNLIMQEGAVSALTSAYMQLARAASSAAAMMPTGFAMPGIGPRGMRAPTVRVQGFNKGVVGAVPGTGNKDTVPALLTPGESVITKDATAKYAPILQAMNEGSIKMLAQGSVPRNRRGGIDLNALQANLYGETALRLEDRSSNRARKVTLPTYQEVLPMLALRAGEASGTPLTQKQMSKGKFDPIAKQLEGFSKKFVKNVEKEFKTTHKGIKDESERLRRAWTSAGKMMRDDISKLPKEYQQVARRYVGAAPDVYNTMATQKRSPGDTTLSSRRKEVQVGKDAPARSMSRLGGFAVALQKRLFPNMKFAPQDIGHVYEPKKTSFADIAKLPGRGTQPTVALRNLTGDPTATLPGDKAVSASGKSSAKVWSNSFQANTQDPYTLARKRKSPHALVAADARADGKLYFNTFKGTVGTINIPTQVSPPTGKTQAARERMLAGGMTSTQAERALRKYGSRIGVTEKPVSPRVSARERMLAGGMTATQADRMMRKYGDRINPYPRTPGAARMSVSRSQQAGINVQPQRERQSVQAAEGKRQVSALKAARQAERAAWRQFGGSLTGLGAVILSGPVTDLARFSKRELKTFTGQMKSAVNGMKKGFGSIVEAARGAGNRLLDATPSAFRGAPMPADIANKARVLGNKAFGGALVGGINAIERSAKQIRRFGVLLSDMGQAAKYGDVKSATKMLSNAIGGTKAIKPILDASKNLGGSVRNAWTTLRSATRDIRTTFNALGAVDAARMARNIVGLDKVGQSLRNTTSNVVTNVKSFGSTVGSAFKDVRTVFRSEGFRAAGQMAAQITGVTQSWNKAKGSFTNMMRDTRDIAMGSRALGKEMLTNARTSISSTFSNLGKSVSNAALRSFDSALGGWGALKKSFAGVGSAFKDAGTSGAAAVKASLLAAARTIGGGGGGIGGLFGLGRGGMDDERRQAIMDRRNRRMAGGGMALSMASMAPFMMQDQEGKFMGMNANMIGMGMMGAGALLSMAGLVSAKFIALAGIAAAAGVALYAYRNSVDEAARKASDFGANVGGAANALNNMASMLGKATPAQRQTQMRLAFTEEEEMSFGEFQSMFETEAGQKFINNLKDATSTERFNLLSQYIKTAVAAGLMDVEVAPAFAKTVAVALEDSFLGASMVSAIRQGLQRGSTGLLDLAQQRETAVQQTQAMRNLGAENQVSYEDSSAIVGSSIQIIQDFSNAAALAKEEYANGTISYDQYISVLDEATEAQARYSGVLSDAISKSSDIGATAQALNKQLGLLVSSEDLQRLTSAADIGTDTMQNIREGMLSPMGLLLGESSIQHMQRELKESNTMALMAEAIASGMNAATVAAIQQYIKENPESAGAQAFERYAGQGGEFQFKAAAMAENIEFMGLPGDLEKYLTEEQYIDIAIAFEKTGGDVADFETFMASIPEEKAIDVVLAFKGMSPEDQLKFINSFTNLSNLLGTENANKVEELLYARAAATPTTVGVPGVPGASTTTTLGAQQTSIEQQLADKQNVLVRQKYSAGAGTAEGQAAIAQTQTEIDALEKQLEDVTGKIYQIKMELDPASQQAIEDAMEIKSWDEDTTTLIIEILLQSEGNLELLPQYAEYASLLDQLPEEVRTILAIDTASLPDLQQFGPQAEGLAEGVALIEALPNDVDKELAFSMMVDENGKVKNPKQILSSVRNLQKDFKNIEKIEDSKLRKTMIFELMQQVTDENGQQITEDAFQQRYQELVDRYGQQVISNLPPDVLFKAIMFDYNADQLKAEAAALRAAAARLANIGGAEAQVAKMLEDAAAMEAAASALSGMAGSAAATGAAANYSGGGNNSGGGGGGGGGGGEEDPLEAMMKDLKTQKKLVGDYVKEQEGVSSGFATALRRAGTPEYLIAEIIAKGEDGIKIAKKLLADKKKKLQELMKLSLEVARFTLIEAQRAAVGNFKAQSSAQNILFGAGVDPTVAMDIASDPAQAAMIVAERQKVADAEAKLAEARKKGKGVEKAQKELRRAQKDWNELTSSIKRATLAQKEFEKQSAPIQVAEMARQQRETLGRQQAALTRLMSQGFTFEQAQEFAGDETISLALVSTGRAADAAARRVAYLDKKLKELKKAKGKNRNEKEIRRVQAALREARKEADRTSEAYKSLTDELKALTEAQRKNLIINTTREYEGLTEQLGKQLTVLGALISAGISYEQATAIANDPTRATAFYDALQEGGAVWKDLISQAQAYDRALADVSVASKIFEFQEQAQKNLRIPEVNSIAKQFGGQYSGMVAETLMGMTPAELEAFFRMTDEQQKEWIDNLLASVPVAEKIKYLFDQINAAQKYQSLLNRDATDAKIGDREALEDQLKAQRKLLKIEQDKLKAIQKTVDVIQEENDDYNRGLDLLSRQEEKINEAFDKRLESLDKVEQANARIAQQQQNQLNLAQALSTGDIYAATQAAQQIKQDNATAAIENTREALELAREEQLKNLVVEVNGALLTREQIEKRIEANNDRIYQIQEDQIEPIEAVIDGIQDQIDNIETLRDAWQDYYDDLEKNAVDPLTGMKYSDLAKIKEYYDALIGTGMETGAAFNEAMAKYVAGGGKITDEARLRGYFGIAAIPEASTTPEAGSESEESTVPEEPTTPEQPPVSNEEDEEGDELDLESVRDQAIAALPEVIKVKDAAIAIKNAFKDIPKEITKVVKSLKESAQPAINQTKAAAQQFLNKFKDTNKFIAETLIPDGLRKIKNNLIGKDGDGGIVENVNQIREKFVSIKDFVSGSLINNGINKFKEALVGEDGDGGLLKHASNIKEKFVGMNNQLTTAISKVIELVTEIKKIPKEIIVTVKKIEVGEEKEKKKDVPAQLISMPRPSPGRIKKFAGGLIKMASGGMIPGGIPRDSIPMLASPGEFIVRNSMVDKYGMSMLNDINQGSFDPTFRIPASSISYTTINKPDNINTNHTMYNNNYSINVTANTNASADEIASAAVMKIRQMNSMQIRGARG